MLDTLQKMSGTTHVARKDGKTVTKNKMRIAFQNEDTVTVNITTREVPVITYNDMAFISERQSIVFRAGDSPIWNRNEAILPMSWRLFQNTVVHAGHEYSLQTIPTLSSALDFDVRKNQPDFTKMLDKRMDQAKFAETAKRAYQEAYNFSDYQIEQLDPDNYADDIMTIINQAVRQHREEENLQSAGDFEGADAKKSYEGTIEENTEQLEAIEAQQREMAENSRKIYAGGTLSKEDLVPKTGFVVHQYDKDIVKVYVDNMGHFARDIQYFERRVEDLYGRDGQLYIAHGKVDQNLMDDLEKLNKASEDPNHKVYIDETIKAKDLKDEDGYTVTDAFIKFLVSLPKWSFANGFFEKGMARRMHET